MSASIPAVDSVSPVPQVASRQTRAEPSHDATGGGAAVADDPRKEAISALSDGVSRIQFGGHTAAFSYDETLDRVVVRIYSGDTPPREVIRQIPPADYVAFVTRCRELFGVLFDNEF
jgi:uncharacterized FlaG/YvyC family protein